jgi:hypothetical protein
MENNANNLFIEASRKQLRFVAGNGHLTVEDLWSLSLKNLDSLAVGIYSRLMDQRTSFLANPDPKANAAAKDDEMRLEILKVIIDLKQTENKAAADASAKKAQRAFLSNLLEKKKIDALEGLSVEEIEAQLAAMPAE